MRTYWWFLMAMVSVAGWSQEGPAPTAGEKAAREAQAKAATELKVEKEVALDLGNKVKLDLVLIPPGKFTMGSPETEKERFDTECPQHEAELTKAFYLGKYEVTQEQYEAVMGNNPSNFKGAKDPVACVSWNDATEFCKKLSAKSGKVVRLPTEAEWEYAARTGGPPPVFSRADLDKIAWWAGNSNGNPHPVGQKKPNAWGLYDMFGNVWEWCWDWCRPYKAEAVKDPQGPANGEVRVLRGGSWNVDPMNCRSTNRNRCDPGAKNGNGGFRAAVSGPVAVHAQ